MSSHGFRALPLAALLLTLTAPETLAATYYISPEGSNRHAGLSEDAPFLTFHRAFSKMRGGDELVLLDGTYTVETTGVLNYRGKKSRQPPSGPKPGRPTVIRAKNPGRVTVDGSGDVGNRGVYLGRTHRKDKNIHIEGIIFEGGGVLFNTRHVTIKGCGFHARRHSGDTIVFGIGSNDHNRGNTDNLIEDVFIWGNSQKAALNYRSDRNVWRRVVIRHDGCDPEKERRDCGTGGKWPVSGISVYNSRHTILENVLVLDSTMFPRQRGSGMGADFTHTQHDNPRGDPRAGPNEWLGCLSLASQRPCTMFEVDLANDRTETVRDFVCWDARAGLGSQKKDAGCTHDCPRNVLYDGVTTDGGFFNRGIPGVLQDIVSLDAHEACIETDGLSIRGATVHGCGKRDYARNRCTGDRCHDVDPRGGERPSLLYLPRVEPGSPLAGAGVTGDIGANLIRYGEDGTRFGDEGVTRPGTVDDLWPWPMEALIKEKICASTVEHRGLCAEGDDRTLSRYVWEYLGHPWSPD